MSGMIKICMISDRNIYMKRICNFLAKNNFEVHLVSRHPNGLDHAEFDPRITHHQFSTNKLYRKYLELNKLIKRINPDIVHLHYLTKDAALPVLIWPRRFRYLITIWGSDINIFAINRMNRVFQNIGLISSDQIHLLSRYFEQKVKQIYRFIRDKKLLHFSWGVDYNFFHFCPKDSISEICNEFSIKPDDQVVLSYRTHREIYNHHTLVESIPKVLDSYPNTIFIFTCFNADEAYLSRNISRCKELNVSHNIRFIKRWLSDQELRALIHTAHICVNIPVKDGLPATLLEIMSARSIPIVSNLVNYHYFFSQGQNGFYLRNLEDSFELSNLIKGTLENYKELSDTISRINNAYIENTQNWRIQSQRLLDLYQNV
jgi:hypothetical protein